MSPANEPDSNLTILLLGSGGREHALAWKLASSPSTGRLVCAPGNPGIANVAELRQVDAENGAAVVDLAREIEADLVVIGPEAPLAAGVSDALRDAGFAVFGPSKAAARLEWDKAFSKEFMQRHAIPTAASRAFTDSDLDAGRAYLESQSYPIVLKANGLAAGKGVVIATNQSEAVETLESMLAGDAFGDAGKVVVVEEFMKGEEASIFAISDGERYLVLPSSQDHKRIGDGDTGPNTGGMGAYAPAPIVTDELIATVREKIIEPTLAGMREEGNPYIGCLYVGIMINNGEPRVVEFNSRFGDPETQVVLPLVEEDLARTMLDAAHGSLDSSRVLAAPGVAVCVVMASEGYPGDYRKGIPIEGLAEAEQEEGVIVFHAGTKSDGDRIVTSGGRVLGVTAVSTGTSDLTGTILRAYAALGRISFAGAQFRGDIGARAVGDPLRQV
jgi:phosphoribosylamine--glycine ligase